MPAGKSVLPLQEKRARELEAHARQFRVVDQNRAERRDGFVEERGVALWRALLPGCLDRAQTQEKTDIDDVGPGRVGRQRPEGSGRLLVATRMQTTPWPHPRRRPWTGAHRPRPEPEPRPGRRQGGCRRSLPSRPAPSCRGGERTGDGRAQQEGPPPSTRSDAAWGWVTPIGRNRGSRRTTRCDGSALPSRARSFCGKTGGQSMAEAGRGTGPS